MDIREKDEITIEFTEDLLDMWTKEYFKKHPRAKKKPIKSPSHDSLNTWIILRRPMMNLLKQNWKSFGQFVVEKHGLTNLGISKCKCRYVVYRDTSRRRDLDNTVPKLLLDSLTAEASGLIVDDSYECITELTLCFEYHKGIKGARLEFTECEYDKELLEKTRIKEQGKTEKREKTLQDNKLNKKSKKKSK